MAAEAAGVVARRVCRVLALGFLLVALTVSAGWAFEVPGLRSLLPGSVDMTFHTAFALACIARHRQHDWHAVPVAAAPPRAVAQTRIPCRAEDPSERGRA